MILVFDRDEYREAHLARSTQPLRAYLLATQQQCIARLKGLALIGSRRKKDGFKLV
jgi:hypothetical protein